MASDDNRVRPLGDCAQFLHRAHRVNCRSEEAWQRFLFPMIHRIGRIDGQQQRFAIGQTDQEGLMSGRMTGRENGGQGAITVNVVEIIIGAVQELPVQPGGDRNRGGYSRLPQTSPE